MEISVEMEDVNILFVLLVQARRFVGRVISRKLF
jgi:hypothetical protein